MYKAMSHLTQRALDRWDSPPTKGVCCMGKLWKGPIATGEPVAVFDVDGYFGKIWEGSSMMGPILGRFEYGSGRYFGKSTKDL